MSEGYERLAPIAKSYYGELSLCADAHGEVVAVRRLATGHGADPLEVQRIAEGARDGMGNLHERAVPLLDVEDEDGVLVVSQYIDGTPLTTIARMLTTRRDYPTEAAARIVADALQGLAGLSRHPSFRCGGLSPDALLVGADGRTRLLEWPLHACFGSLPALARHQNRASYQAPETIDDPESIDDRADVFSMGVVLWELLHRQRLFAGLGYDAIAAQVRGREVPRYDGAEALAEALDKALQRDRDQRFEDPAAFAAALEAAAPAADHARVADLFDALVGSHPSIQSVRDAARGKPIQKADPSSQRHAVPRTTMSGRFVFDGGDRPSLTSAIPADSVPPPSLDVTELGRRGPQRQIGRGELFAEVARDDLGSTHVGRWIGAAGFARLIAVNVLHETLANNYALVAAYLGDVRVIARIKHPNLVPIHDVLEDKGELCVVMDHIVGVSLSHLLRQLRRNKEAMPIAVASRIVSGVLHGLDAAHRSSDQGGRVTAVLHRNVCPESVHIGVDGFARLLDFGLARGLEAGGVEHSASRHYRAPEQLRGQPPDPRTDIYGASVLAYQLFVGRRPFQGTGLDKKILRGSPPRPTKLRAELPPKLEQLVLRGMAPEPDARWDDAETMAEALDALPGMASHREVGEWVRRVAHDRVERTERLRRAIEGAAVVLSADELDDPLSVDEAARESIAEARLFAADLFAPSPSTGDVPPRLPQASERPQRVPARATSKPRRPPVVPVAQGSPDEETTPDPHSTREATPAPSPPASASPATASHPTRTLALVALAALAVGGLAWLATRGGAPPAAAPDPTLESTEGQQNAPSAAPPPLPAPAASTASQVAPSAAPELAPGATGGVPSAPQGVWPSTQPPSPPSSSLPTSSAAPARSAAVPSVTEPKPVLPEDI